MRTKEEDGVVRRTGTGTSNCTRYSKYIETRNVRVVQGESGVRWEKVGRTKTKLCASNTS